ncbi:inner membrane-spanning protein YciB [Pseudoprimorskyibacter insulae]|uniref:Inner membrane-spanning protein YciB n=1 Tax=Pseudoprimorskyibacter insulae TaxID=1695997 RepID=A0A2R8AQH2_9RHOB|nr:inner membrane-spanning protein YciB [Pseudoprimorskyibacter insulae]SPF78293.1 Intracellular septation protein [Pseudoprimorskyibacter insulae]
MDDKQVNPLLKSALELGPVLAFFAAYLLLKDRSFVIGGTEYDGFIVVTAAFIPLLLTCTGLLWRLSGKVSKMQVVTVVLVIVFGGLSVWLNDERFFKMKPTLIYMIFAAILGAGILQGRSYLEYVMEGAMPLRHEGWMILTKRVAMFFFALAIANEVIWRFFTTETWVYFKTFGLTAALFAFFMTQGGLIQKYGTEGADKT